MKRIVLIGSGGQLGSDIRKIFTESDFEIVPLTHADIEITNFENTRIVLERLQPVIVINTAAYHNVDEAEENIAKAFAVNSTANKNLAEICDKNDWTLVFISTDYVFGFDKNKIVPYEETDETGPVNIYGESKLAGEKAIMQTMKNYFVIRVCGLYGVAGSSGKGGNFVELMLRLGKEKGEVNVVEDQIMTPTYTTNVAENLFELLQTDNYGLYHMTSEGQCSWWEFASEIFRQTGMQVKCNKVDSNFFQTKAKRPKYSVLENHNLKKIGLNRMRDWKENLHLYLIEKKHL